MLEVWFFGFEHWTGSGNIESNSPQFAHNNTITNDHFLCLTTFFLYFIVWISYPTWIYTSWKHIKLCLINSFMTNLCAYSAWTLQSVALTTVQPHNYITQNVFLHNKNLVRSIIHRYHHQHKLLSHKLRCEKKASYGFVHAIAIAIALTSSNELFLCSRLVPHSRGRHWSGTTPSVLHGCTWVRVWEDQPEVEQSLQSPSLRSAGDAQEGCRGKSIISLGGGFKIS